MTAKKDPPWYVKLFVLTYLLPFGLVGFLVSLSWAGLKIGWNMAETLFE